MTISKNTFIDAYGIDLSDDLNGRNTGQEPRNDHDQLDTSRQSARASANPAVGRQVRFDQAQNRQTLRGPHFPVPPAEPTPREAVWEDMSVIDVGAGWSAHEEVAAPAPIANVEPEPAAPSITPQQTTVAETAAESFVEAADVVARTVVQATPEPIPTAVIDEPVAAAPVNESVEGGKVEAKVAETTCLPTTTPVVPAWEVDRFAWPADIQALFEEQTDYFEHAGQKLLAASREGLTKLAITSALPGEGTTTVTLCLARAVAAVGGRVAVLDGNLRNSQIGRALSLEFASGWQVAAAGAVELAEAAIAAVDERITLFPASAAAERVSGLADESVGEVLRRAAEGFDLLLI